MKQWIQVQPIFKQNHVEIGEENLETFEKLSDNQIKYSVLWQVENRCMNRWLGGHFYVKRLEMLV